MKRCTAKPYEGREKYIFVSYCHRDRAQVFPVIEQLVKDGYRIWYDEGIDPGSEWPEIIAKHLNDSAICIAFITANSLNSHNCRREINFALLKKKFFISVVLEPAQMSLGMEMQLSSSQSIFKYTLTSEREFFAKLYEAKELENCKGSPNYSIDVSTPSDYLNELNDFVKVRDPFSDRWFARGGDDPSELIVRKTTEQAARNAADEERRKAEEAARKAAEEEERREAEEAAYEITEEEAARKAAEEEERCKTEEAARKAAEAAEREKRKEPVASIHMLKRQKTGEIITINKSPFNIGRSSSSDDYVITDNRSVSRGHACLVIRDDICYIMDNHSLNKTFINDLVLSSEAEYALTNGDSIRLYNERFVYLKCNS